MNFTELISEVRTLLGKGSDTNLVTTDRVGRWLNDAQRKIVRENPGLRDVHVLDETAFWITSSTYKYELSGLTYDIAHLRRFWCHDPGYKKHYRIDPVPGGNEYWDAHLGDPSYSASGGYPTYYFRRGEVLELNCIPNSNMVVLAVTGATGTDASPSVISSSGSFEDLTLTGKSAYITGTNVTGGYYTIASNTDDTITLGSNCSSGGAGEAITVNIGAVIWCEYEKLPVDMTGTDNPTLTDFDNLLTGMAQAIAMRSPVLKRWSEGVALEGYINQLVRARIDSHRAIDRSHTNPCQG